MEEFYFFCKENKILSLIQLRWVFHHSVLIVVYVLNDIDARASICHNFVVISLKL